jgi:hypothetical protein
VAIGDGVQDFVDRQILGMTGPERLAYERQQVEGAYIKRLRRISWWSGWLWAVYAAGLLIPVALGFANVVHIHGTPAQLFVLVWSAWLIGGAVGITNLIWELEFRAQTDHNEQLGELLGTDQYTLPRPHEPS